MKSLIDRIFQRHRASVAETAWHDLHQRAELGIAVVGAADADVERILDSVRELVEREPEIYLTQWEAQLLEPAP